MTCIVGIQHKGKVYIGGDSLGTDSAYGKTVRADEKVFVSGEMIFGFCGSYRLGQLLRYTLSIPPRVEGLDDMTYLVGSFIPAVIQAYEQGKNLTTNRGEASQPGEFLLGYRGELYLVQCDFQVGRPTLPYETTGCGADLAKGSLFATPKLKPEERITLALKAAETHSAGVGGPFLILSV